MKDVGIWDL